MSIFLSHGLATDLFSQLFRRADIPEHWISQSQWQTCLAHVHCYQSETMPESTQLCPLLFFPDQCPFLSMAVSFHPLTLRLSTFQGNRVPTLPWTNSDLKNFSNHIE